MAIRCLAAEVSRQPNGVAGLSKSTGSKGLLGKAGLPRAVAERGLRAPEEGSEGTCKGQTKKRAGLRLLFLYIHQNRCDGNDNSNLQSDLGRLSNQDTPANQKWESHL